jgi:adenosylmethionine-8-amino-7-oxononanoate aminotransferase
VPAGAAPRRVFVALAHASPGSPFGAWGVGAPAPFFGPSAPLFFRVARGPRQGGADALARLGARAAGVIVEPLVQAAGGMRMHAAATLGAIRAACDAWGVPLIADEVFTGFGRTGTLFACEQAGITPDLLCLAKGLTGGLFPLAVTLTTESVYEAFLSSERARAFFHGHTHTAHPIGCAVARASLALCREERVPERLAAIGARIAAALEPVAASERVLDLRRTGGVVALELRVPAGSAGGYLSDLAPRLRAAAAERGVLLRPLGAVLYSTPPACTSDEQCARIAEVMAELAEL